MSDILSGFRIPKELYNKNRTISFKVDHCLGIVSTVSIQNESSLQYRFEIIFRVRLQNAFK